MMSTDKRWVVVSNRLPVHFDNRRKKFVISSGGLVSSLLGVDYRHPILWLGLTTEQWDADEIAAALGINSRIKVIPLTVAEDLYDPYYNSFCNGVLWPLLHYETHSVSWNLEAWQKYQEINRIVAATLLKQTSANNDLIWIHDFHLMLVAAQLRLKRRRQGIGFFLHVPFPSYEIFRQLPFRSTILRALLAHDLLGFHDYSYLMHFSQTLHYVLGVNTNFNRVHVNGRSVNLGVYPVSIPTLTINKAARSKRVKDIYASYRKRFRGKRIILGVDRLDYIKGIDLKLDIFHSFLQTYPEHRDNVSLMQVVVPSRIDVPAYQQLKENIEGHVGYINGYWGKADYVPIYYIYNSLQFHELLALCQLSDCLLITSKRDGMNLVALEYVAAQTASHPGQVLLSEFAGAVAIMPNAIAINPWHVEKSAAQLHQALQADSDAIATSNTQMLAYLKNYTGSEWASSFMVDLLKSARQSEKLVEDITFPIRKNSPLLEKIKKIKAQRSRFLFIDFDGTLVPIQALPQQVAIAVETLDALTVLQEQHGFAIGIISGRERRFLSQQFASRSFMLAAEHGAEFYSCKYKRWRSLVTSPQDNWFPLAAQMMQYYQQRVPGSFIEKKAYSLCWHYRNSPPLYADYQARKLTEELEFGLANFPAIVASGKKIVEAKAIEASKGAFAGWFIKNCINDSDAAIIALGDDLTDEELFLALRPTDISIKVGTEETKASWRLREQKDVLTFLHWLAEH